MHGKAHHRPGAMALLVVLCLAPGGAQAQVPASPDPLYDEAQSGTTSTSFPDPFERVNRATFRLNEHLERWVIDPLVRAYDFAVPAPARRALRRALTNLDSPAVFANDVLQCAPVDATVTATRFAVNTTAGVLGLFDPATPLGLARHQADFGQTLALVGVPSGPYLILPLVGPTTARDGAGYLVDFVFRPTTYLLTPGSQVVFTTVTEGGAGLVMFDANAEALHALEASAIDYYAALRSAFYQDRMARIWGRRPAGHPLVVAARRLLHALPFGTAGGEVGDLAAQRGDQALESVALDP